VTFPPRNARLLPVFRERESVYDVERVRERERIGTRAADRVAVRSPLAWRQLLPVSYISRIRVRVTVLLAYSLSVSLILS